MQGFWRDLRYRAAGVLDSRAPRNAGQPANSAPLQVNRVAVLGAGLEGSRRPAPCFRSVRLLVFLNSRLAYERRRVAAAMEPVKLNANNERIAKVRTKMIMAAPADFEWHVSRQRLSCVFNELERL
jgi:hypothetical protein